MQLDFDLAISTFLFVTLEKDCYETYGAYKAYLVHYYKAVVVTEAEISTVYVDALIVKVVKTIEELDKTVDVINLFTILENLIANVHPIHPMLVYLSMQNDVYIHVNKVYGVNEN